MLNKYAEKDFLERELESYEWMKDLSSEDLDKSIKLLIPQPRFKTPLWWHQKICFLIGVTIPKFLFLLDMSTGKTFITLSVIEYRKLLGETKSALVIVPNIVNIETWTQQIKEHTPSLTYSAIEGTRHEREAALLDCADIYIVTYAGLNALCTQKKFDSKRKKNKRVPDKGRIKMLASRFDTIVCDESDYLKNHRSLSYRVCSAIAKGCPYRFALTGTPMGRDPIDFWSQFKLIDEGETLGPTLGLFRGIYFKKEKNWFGFDDYKFKTNLKDHLYNTLRNRSIYFDSSVLKGLPKVVQTPLYVKMPKLAYVHYGEVLDTIGEDMLSLQSKFVRLRQIASGFIGHKDEDESKIELAMPANPKLEALLELVDNLPSGKKMIIFHEYIWSGQTISKELDARKIKHERLWSGTKNPKEALRNFTTDKNCRIFVMNSNSGARGLNLQVCNYVVFYETPVSPRIRQQAEKRCHRPGQKNTVFMYDIIMRGSVDEKIYHYLKEGKDLFKALVSRETTLV